MESGQSGEGTWDGERVMQDNFNAITSADSPRLSQLLRERDIVSNTGAAVKDMLGEHPALQALQIPVNAATKAYDTTGPDGTADGVLTIDDFKASDFETLCQLLENPKQLISLGLNPDLGYTLVADMMTRQNLKNWQQGTTAQESNNEQAGIEIASTDTPEASSTGVTAADLINDTINQPTNMRETGSVAPTTIPTGSSDRPQGTFVERQVPLMPQEQELRDATVRRDAPIITPREDVIAKLKDTVYSGTQSSRKGSGSVIQQLKKQFERQARSMGMSEVDIDNLFSSGDAIITKSPDGKYTVRLRTDADENLPKQTPSGKAV
jgi:predicted  nucleic acid-binding Zn-ribbon protein